MTVPDSSITATLVETEPMSSQCRPGWVHRRAAQRTRPRGRATAPHVGDSGWVSCTFSSESCWRSRWISRMDRLRCSSASKLPCRWRRTRRIPRRQQVGAGKREGFAQRPTTPRSAKPRQSAPPAPPPAAPSRWSFEVARHRVAQPAQDLGRRVALLLRVDHVALGEHRAAPRDPRRALGRADDPADLLHRVLHAQRLLIEERPGARRALPDRS